MTAGFSDLTLESEPAPDKDDFTDMASSFPMVYHQQSSVAMGLDKSYVLHLAQCGDNLCSVSDTGALNLYTMDTLTKTHTLVPHTKAVTGLVSNPSKPDMVLTCSADQSVKVWDMRVSPHTAVHTLCYDTPHTADPPATPGKPLTCVGVNTAGLVAAGTEEACGDTFLLFWDIRVGARQVGGYWDTHNDDITTLQFHSDKPDILATGSTDGQVNVFNLAEQDEDSALMSSINTQDSVGRVLWYSNREQVMNLAIQTHTEGVQLWDTEQPSPGTVLHRGDVCQGMRRSVSDYTYIAGIHTVGDGVGVVGGSSYSPSPCIGLAEVRNKVIKPLARLGTGGVVRCSVKYEGGFVTGGEDGVIRVWKEGTEEDRSKDSVGKTSNSKPSIRDKPY